MTDPTDNGIDAAERRAQAMQRAAERFRKIQQTQVSVPKELFRPFDSDAARHDAPSRIGDDRSDIATERR